MLCKHLTAACRWVIQTDTLGKIWHEIKTPSTWKLGHAKTDRLATQSATKTMTAQLVSMVHLGGTQESERGGKGSAPGLGPPLQAARKNELMATKGSHSFPSKTKPFLYPSCSLCHKGSHSAQTVPEVLYACCVSSQPGILSVTFSPPRWSPSLMFPSPSTGDK